MNFLKFLTNSFLALCIIKVCNAQVTFITTGANWKYNTGSDLDTAWRMPGYNDSTWISGASQLGYGDGDEATVIPFGGDVSNKYPCYYFRHKFSVANPSAQQPLVLKVKRDDGIVVYVNGQEIFRDNMPDGIVSYNTLAVTSLGGTDETTWLVAVLSPAVFVNGINLIAAEVHQADVTSSDVTFDLELTAGVPPAVAISRGPYLQLATSSGIYLRWKTNISTDSKVRYGAVLGSLNQSSADLMSTTDHIIQLTGLLPDTKYFYSVGSESLILQGDSSHFFITPPLQGTEKLTRVWVTGDCGTAQTVQTNVMTAYQNFIGNNYTDLWLLLGDNAYDNGKDAEYQAKFFQPYMNGNVMRQTVLFPAPGNHDYANNADSLESRSRPYHQIFTLPKAGEAGGVPSGTEMYYSYNYANIHFISLDSYGTESGKKIFDTTSAQINWLKQDLAANTQKWTILYWHHPPYTMGSHNSDTESELVNIRNSVLRILDRYKVDLVLCGHSHNYERSKIMKGHYGLENTYSPALHNASTSSGLYDGSTNSCPYVKTSDSGQNEGIVYVVSGSAGKVGAKQGAYPHDAMYYSNSSQGGSLYLVVDGNRLDAKWISESGSVLDKFTVMKDVNTKTDMTMLLGDSIQLSASWHGAYQWNPLNAQLKTVTVSPTADTNYYVTDSAYNCLHDTFSVKVNVKISGAILTESGVPVPGVSVSLTGAANRTEMTGADGHYDFEVAQGGNYSVVPYKDNDSAVGVTTLDIALIQRHILAIGDLNSPYKIIAAASPNAPNDTAITTLDIIRMRQMILGMANTFPGGRLWEFVRSDFTFSNPMMPFPFERSRYYTNINSNQLNQNFIGIKMGDANNSWGQ